MTTRQQKNTVSRAALRYIWFLPCVEAVLCRKSRACVEGAEVRENRDEKLMRLGLSWTGSGYAWDDKEGSQAIML